MSKVDQFTWRAKPDTKLLLVGGGSGVVPLMSMLRHRAAMNKGWQLAPVKAIKHETGDVKTFMLEPGDGFRFVAGQHIDVRLTAPDLQREI